MELLQSHEVEALRNENVRLLTENGELRKMVGLMQENLELRCTLRDHESRVRTLSPPGKEHKDKEAHCGKDGKKDPSHASHAPPCRDPKQLQRCQRVVGEIAFQLDRRILSSIFLEQSRLYGFTVSNVQEKIIQATTCPLNNKVDEAQRCEMNRRYQDMMCRLKKYGYDPRVHPIFSEYLVNTYGIMKDRPLPGSGELASFSDPEVLRKMASEAMPADVLKDVQLLLNCLVQLAKEDGKPLFIW
ncbi:speriolin-like protein [Pleurodeles waltl]|uniref:speriolin-like protein n=1 Tax=Pleurodeles waltl TaxID=8319 RepID=UPI00370952B7